MNGLAHWQAAATEVAWLPLALVAAWVAASGAIRIPEARLDSETLMSRPRVALGTMWASFLAVCGVGVALLGVLQHVTESDGVLRLGASAAFLALALGQRRHTHRASNPLATRFGDAVLATWAQPALWGVAVAIVAGFAATGEWALEQLLLVASGFAWVHGTTVSLMRIGPPRVNLLGWAFAAGLVWA